MSVSVSSTLSSVLAAIYGVYDGRCIYSMMTDNIQGNRVPGRPMCRVCLCVVLKYEPMASRKNSQLCKEDMFIQMHSNIADFIKFGLIAAGYNLTVDYHSISSR